MKDEIKKFFKGDIEDSDESLTKYSHDASLLEVRPELVLFPKGSDDIKALVKWVQENKENDKGDLDGDRTETDEELEANEKKVIEISDEKPVQENKEEGKGDLEDDRTETDEELEANEKKAIELPDKEPIELDKVGNVKDYEKLIRQKLDEESSKDEHKNIDPVEYENMDILARDRLTGNEAYKKIFE